VAKARFGTDGVRGVANDELTAELALAIGRATARVLPAQGFVVGRDTRRSGPMLSAALSAGLATEGADVFDVGVLPTPGVATVAARRRLPGAVVSASHNPFADNGIKLFSSLGTKLPVGLEADVEREIASILEDSERLHIALDCANGAASAIAPGVFAALGATVTTLHDTPDGANINEKCGSTHPGELAKTVAGSTADLGLAFDGDADRVIAVDHSGLVVDGDVLLALFALDLASRGHLAGNTVVVTVMTNLGFRLAMESHGIGVRETDVGDRHVLAALDADGLALGGEQSGHIIFRTRSTTGDGILTGIALGDLMQRAGRSLADLADGLVERVPQVLVNVPIPQPGRLADCAEVWEAVAKAEVDLGHEGRVLLRPSGTEPLVRVMVEARAEAQANEVAAQLAEVVKGALGQVGG
jgi:phosphoglucosamine mutase